MQSTRKLRSNEAALLLAFVLLLALVALIYAQKNIGFAAAIGIWGLLVVVNAPISLAEFLKTKNPGFLYAFLFQICAGIFAAHIVLTYYVMDPWLLMVYILCLLGFGSMGLYYNFSRRSKWRYREVLELAAQPVREVTDGFTRRPKPIGKIDANREEIENFARYLLQHLVAIPYFEADRTVFSLAMTLRHRTGFRSDYEDFSHVLFYHDGRVAAHLSQNDYLKYREQYAYDQLCDALGRLFIEFYQYHRNGESVRIMDRLNELKLNPLADFGENAA